MIEQDNYRHLVTPLFDFLNHSFEPNCRVVLSEKDFLGKKTPTVELEALRKIDIGEQLLINYGNYSNISLLQKFGFTVPNNPYNSLQMTPKYHEEQYFISEEAQFKKQLLEHHQIEASLFTPQLQLDKFDPNIIKSLRVMMLRGDMILSIGKEKLLQTDFSKPVNDLLEYAIKNALSREIMDQYT